MENPIKNIYDNTGGIKGFINHVAEGVYAKREEDGSYTETNYAGIREGTRKSFGRRATAFLFPMVKEFSERPETHKSPALRVAELGAFALDAFIDVNIFQFTGPFGLVLRPLVSYIERIALQGIAKGVQRTFIKENNPLAV